MDVARGRDPCHTGQPEDVYEDAARLELRCKAACLRAREHSGHGYHIDMALLDCAAAAQVNLAQAFLTSGQVPPRLGNAHLQIVPYQLFATGDGWLVLAVGNDGQWQQFCRAAGRPDLAGDERFASNSSRVRQRDVLVPILEAVMKSATTADWQRRLREVGVPHAPVWNYADLFASPHAGARQLRVTVRDARGNPVDLLGSPFHITGVAASPPRTPPELGQDTVMILKEALAVGEERIRQLREQRVI